MVKVKNMRHSPQLVLESRLHLGTWGWGRPRKSWTIKTKEIQTGDPYKPDIYCYFKVSHHWVYGPVLGYTGARRTKLSHILRAEIQTITDCTGNDPAVVEAEAEPPNDSMDQMEILPAAKPKPAKRFVRNEARTVRIPEFPPGADPGDSYRTIKLYIVDKKQIWLHQDDVEWALRYLFMEHKLRTQGIAAVDSHGDVSPDQA